MYNVIKMSPNTPHAATVKSKPLSFCRKYLSVIRKEYADGLPPHERKLCRFDGRDAIIVKCITGKTIRYNIFSA